MTVHSEAHQPESDAVTARVTAAAARLVAGEALFCDGSLTVSALAAEAGVTRTLLYTPRFLPLLDAFRSDAERLGAPPRAGWPQRKPGRTEADEVQKELAEARDDLTKRRAEVATLQALNNAYASQIVHLSAEVQRLRGIAERSGGAVSLARHGQGSVPPGRDTTRL
jgi:hypothetical protein